MVSLTEAWLIDGIAEVRDEESDGWEDSWMAVSGCLVPRR